MYSTCITCSGSLGGNEVLQAFPVGRRLAFDPERGRLWVLCRNCRSWNLAPIEERWEAVEEAAIAFEGAAIGASTEHIALGRTKEGTQLVRIGRAKAPEFAGWRYGDVIVGRWERERRLGWAAFGGWFALAMIPVSIPGSLLFAVGAGVELRRRYRRLRVVGRVEREAGASAEVGAEVAAAGGGEPVRGGDVFRARLITRPEAQGWELRLPRAGGDLVLTGEEGLRVARRLLPFVNEKGVKPGTVQRAVAQVEELGSPDAVFAEVARRRALEEEGALRRPSRRLRLAGVNPMLRTALEIAANEEVERRALEGELALLEQEWREADEIAAIADDLLFPRALRRKLREWREKE